MTLKILFYVLFNVFVSVICDNYHPNIPDDVKTRQKRSTRKSETASYWLNSGQMELDEALRLEPNKKLAKNIVLVIGDGMSLSTNTGGRIYKGQRQGKDGTSSELIWDKFPYVGNVLKIFKAWYFRLENMCLDWNIFIFKVCPRRTTQMQWCQIVLPRHLLCIAEWKPIFSPWVLTVIFRWNMHFILLWNMYAGKIYWTLSPCKFPHWTLSCSPSIAEHSWSTVKEFARFVSLLLLTRLLQNNL